MSYEILRINQSLKGTISKEYMKESMSRYSGEITGINFNKNGNEERGRHD